MYILFTFSNLICPPNHRPCAVLGCTLTLQKQQFLVSIQNLIHYPSTKLHGYLTGGQKINVFFASNEFIFLWA